MAPDTEGLSDTPENANEEYGRGDQDFGGGAGEVEYGQLDAGVGREGAVAEGAAAPRTILADDELEGVVLPGSDDSDPATAAGDEPGRGEEE